MKFVVSSVGAQPLFFENWIMSFKSGLRLNLTCDHYRIPSIGFLLQFFLYSNFYCFYLLLSHSTLNLS